MPHTGTSPPRERVLKAMAQLLDQLGPVPRIRVFFEDPKAPGEEIQVIFRSSIAEAPPPDQEPPPPSPGEQAVLSSLSVDKSLRGEEVARISGYTYSYCRNILPRLVERGLVVKAERGYRRASSAYDDSAQDADNGGVVQAK